MNLFENEEENYCQPVRVGNCWSSSYIEYKSKFDKKTLPVVFALGVLKHFIPWDIFWSGCIETILSSKIRKGKNNYHNSQRFWTISSLNA